MASSPLLFWNVKTEYFPQIKSNNNFYEGCNSKNHLAQVQFIIASEYEQYERKLFSIVDLLVQAGGSFNSLRAIGLLITAIFSYRLFYASLIRALFHFDTTQVEWESEFKKAEKKNKKKKKKSEINLFEEKEKKEKEHSGRKRFESFDDFDKLKLRAKNDSSASEHSEEIKDEELEAGNYSLDKKLGYDEIKEKMLETLGYKTLKYDYKSYSIFKSLSKNY